MLVDLDQDAHDGEYVEGHKQGLHDQHVLVRADGPAAVRAEVPQLVLPVTRSHVAQIAQLEHHRAQHQRGQYQVCHHCDAEDGVALRHAVLQHHHISHELPGLDVLRAVESQQGFHLPPHVPGVGHHTQHFQLLQEGLILQPHPLEAAVHQRANAEVREHLEDEADVPQSVVLDDERDVLEPPGPFRGRDSGTHDHGHEARNRRQHQCEVVLHHPVWEMYLFSQTQFFIRSLTCLIWPLYTTPMYRSYSV